MAVDKLKRYMHGARNGTMTPDPDGPFVRYEDVAAALEAAREDAKRIKRDIADLYGVMPMLPITAETMDAATDWFTRYCIDFYRELNAAHDAAIDQARGKAGQEVGK
jgi:hypothetical protein